MRVLAIGALAAAITAAAQAQTIDSTQRSAAAMDGRLRAEIGVIRGLFGSIHAPPADSFKVGTQVVPAGVTHQGSMAVARGNLEVRGRVTGDAIAIHGDVIVYPGGSVGRNAIAVDGRVRPGGGIVEGDVRSIRGITGSILARAAGDGPSGQPVSTWGALKQVIGWFAVLFAMGIGVLLFAEKNLDVVVVSLETEFSRSFWLGVLAQLAAIPALLLIVLALCVTLIGVLLVPFAIVAYVIALAGLLTLGFIAVARFTGRAFYRNGSGRARAVSLRSLFIGLAIYVGLWFLAAVFITNPIVGSILRAVALAGSWVALTFGLGATILSRAGTQREADRARRPRPVDDLSWQTPTPVTGVVAARRPVAAVKES